MRMRTPRISVKAQESLLQCFCSDVTATQAGEISRVSRQAATRAYRHYRECILQHMRRAPRFGGEVEVDQKQFGTIRAKNRKYLKKMGIKVRAKPIKVIGIYRRGAGDVYTQIIKKEDRDTIMPILHFVLDPRTKVFTDHWRAYNDLGIEDYKHTKTNHSATFKNRKGVHINHIESFWSFAERRLSKFNGIKRRTFELHLKECEFRWNKKKTDGGKISLSLMKRLVY